MSLTRVALVLCFWGKKDACIYPVLLWVLSSSYFDGFTANVYIIIILRISQMSSTMYYIGILFWGKIYILNAKLKFENVYFYTLKHIHYIETKRKNILIYFCHGFVVLCFTPGAVFYRHIYVLYLWIMLIFKSTGMCYWVYMIYWGIFCDFWPDYFLLCWPYLKLKYHMVQVCYAFITHVYFLNHINFWKIKNIMFPAGISVTWTPVFIIPV